MDVHGLVPELPGKALETSAGQVLHTPEGLGSIFWRLMDLKQIIMIKDSNLKKICHSVKKLFLWSRRCQLKKAYISKTFENRRN